MLICSFSQHLVKIYVINKINGVFSQLIAQNSQSWLLYLLFVYYYLFLSLIHIWSFNEIKGILETYSNNCEFTMSHDSLSSLKLINNTTCLLLYQNEIATLKETELTERKEWERKSRSRCEIFGFFLLSFSQNERKIY